MNLSRVIHMEDSFSLRDYNNPSKVDYTHRKFMIFPYEENGDLMNLIEKAKVKRASIS